MLGMTTYAAGCMLIAEKDGELYTLLGKDQYNTYSDYGGKCELCDNNNPKITASREAYEETLGLIYSKQELFYKLSRYPIYIVGQSYTHKPYYMFILWVNFSDNYIINFNTIHNYVCSIPNYTYHFKEKKSIAWFKLNELLDNPKKFPLRNVFFKTISDKKNEIKSFALQLKGLYSK